MKDNIAKSGDSDDERNSRISLETMDTDQCIQKLVRTDQEGSERTQCKIEETAQYWAAQEKKAEMNYRRALELNNTVSNKRVQQLYSEDQPQEVIDQAERQVGSARRNLESIWRVDEAGLSRNSPRHPRTPRAGSRKASISNPLSPGSSNSGEGSYYEAPTGDLAATLTLLAQSLSAPKKNSEQTKVWEPDVFDGSDTHKLQPFLV